MYSHSLELFFLNAKYILYPVDEMDNRTNLFQKFILIYSFYATYFIFKNHLNDSNVSSLFGFKIIL